MKKTFLKYKSLNSFGLLFMLLGLFLLQSCDKNDVSTPTASGPPTIQRVRLTDPTTKDSSLSQTTLGSTIAIVGTNLATAQKVVFNGYSLGVNPAYATDNILIITVHDSIPTIATNPNVKDELTVVTAGGEVTYKFKILPPRPEVNRIGNELAKPGETITLYGRYFYFVDTVKFGAVNVTSGITTAGTSLTVTVPQGVDLATTDVTVRSKSGISVAGRNSKFYSAARSGLLIDWDTKDTRPGILNWAQWGIEAKNIGRVSPFTPLSGDFAVIDQIVPSGGAWNNEKVIPFANYDASTNGGSIWPKSTTNFAATTPLSNIDLKFEVASLFPVNALQVQAWQADFITNYNLKDFVMSADGKWYTVTINLGDMAKSGTKLATYGDLSKTSDFRVLITNPSTANIPAKLAIDNIRIVNNVR